MAPVSLDISRAASQFPARSFFIDVSYHQESVDWVKVKASGISRAILKASQGRADGSSFKDPKWIQNTAGARAAGVSFGAYHFAHLLGSAGSQAKYLASLCSEASGCRFGVLDLEPRTVEALYDRSGSGNVEYWTRSFVLAWRSVSKLPLAIYLSGETIRRAKGGLDWLRSAGLPLWWSGYPPPPFSWDADGPKYPINYKEGFPADAWQYAGGDRDETPTIDEGGKCPGISGDVDNNVILSPAFEALFGSPPSKASKMPLWLQLILGGLGGLGTGWALSKLRRRR